MTKAAWPVRLADRALAAVGRTGVLDARSRSVVWHAYRRLGRRLPPGPRPQRLRGLSVEVPCDPHNPFHRLPYWFGVLYEQPLDRALRALLRPGDAVLDVGANYGHVTLLAAALVHPGGQVHAVEPHAGLAGRLAEHLATQEALAPVRIWPVALGEAPGRATLEVNPDWLGASTLRPEPNADSLTGTFVERRSVDVVRGDDLGVEVPAGARLVVKVDVEGFERQVLAGMPGLLARADAVALEVTPAWHGGAAGVADLWQAMEASGFQAWDLDPSADGAPRRCPLAQAQQCKQTNVLFLRPPLSLV